MTSAAEEPRPVFLASFRVVPKGTNLLLDGLAVADDDEEDDDDDAE